LVLVGDAAEDLDTMYPIYRLREAGYEVHVAAPTRRKVKLVVHDFEEDWDAYTERPGRHLPVDWAFSEVEPEAVHGASDTRWSGARVHSQRPGRGAHLCLLFRAKSAGRPYMPRGTGAGGTRFSSWSHGLRLPTAQAGFRSGRCHLRGGAGCRGRKYRLLHRLARHARVLASFYGHPRAGCRVL